jgi:hypothetical protein
VGKVHDEMKKELKTGDAQAVIAPEDNEDNEDNDNNEETPVDKNREPSDAPEATKTEDEGETSRKRRKPPTDKSDASEEQMTNAEAEAALELELDGQKKKFTAKDVKQLLEKGNNLEKYYTKKYQELGEVARLAEAVKENPQVLERIQKALYEEQTGKPYTPEAARLQQQEKELQQYKVKDGLDAFVAEYPDMTEDEFNQVVYLMGETAKKERILPNPKIVYEAIRSQKRGSELEQLRKELEEYKRLAKDGHRSDLRRSVPDTHKAGSPPSSSGTRERLTMKNALPYAKRMFSSE